MYATLQQAHGLLYYGAHSNVSRGLDPLNQLSCRLVAAPFQIRAKQLCIHCLSWSLCFVNLFCLYVLLNVLESSVEDRIDNTANEVSHVFALMYKTCSCHILMHVSIMLCIGLYVYNPIVKTPPLKTF